MSTKPNNGGPAFPQQSASIMAKDNVYFLDKGGMTIRQFYKAHALTGLLANPEGLTNIAAVASFAANCADALLAEDAEHEKGSNK